MRKTLVSLAAGVLLAGCSLIPKYEQPAAPVDAVYPTGDAYPVGGDAANSQVPPAAELGWRDYFTDPQLRRLIEVALQNNRDLRIAALNMDAYRAQYRIQRAELFPELNGTGQYTAQRVLSPLSSASSGIVGRQFGLALGVTAWEIDLFGRLRSLSESALQTYFSSAEARRSTHIALVASVANAYLTMRADQEQLKLTRDTLGTYERTFNLTRRSFDEGISSRLDLRQAQTSVENARATLAQYTRQVAQDKNALSFLIGASVPGDLPEGLSLDDKLVAEVPAGLPSDLLRNRPDILSAEYQLKAANATIGAARAAFFPSISLTASAGTASRQLSGLFEGGSGTWLFNPQINVPIFTAGSLQASLDYSRIQKDVTVAQYERTIQSAFREVADGLAARGTYTEQLKAQVRLVEASQDYYKLADQRYRTGVDNYLTLLDAQRQLFSAQQTLISDRLNQLTAEVNLYKALGGGWNETAAAAASAAAPAGS